MVRLWCDDQQPSSACWRSEVEHVQSGERWQFDDLNQSLRFLTQLAAQLQAPAETSPALLTPDYAVHFGLLTP
jgi:hypothetical protein